MDDLDDDDMDDEEDVDEVGFRNWPRGIVVAFMERLSSLWDFLDISFWRFYLRIYGAVLNPHAKTLAKNVGHASLQ